MCSLGTLEGSTDIFSWKNLVDVMETANINLRKIYSNTKSFIIVEACCYILEYLLQ